MLADEKNHCQYKERVLWAYLKALEQTEVWPSERVSHGHSIEEIIKKLEDKFTCSDPHPGGTESCFRCKGNFAIDVKKAIECTRAYFDGLCLSKRSYHSFNVDTANNFDRLHLHLEDGRQGRRLLGVLICQKVCFYARIQQPIRQRLSLRSR